MKPVFISYRRDDTSGYGGRLDDALRHRFGDDGVFRDIDAIRPGADFVATIEAAVAGSGAVIALIGKDWLTITDTSGRRRLDDPGDFVRLEIASALHKGIDVIPVLVEGAGPPGPSDLPESIAVLGRRQAIELSDDRWDYDVGRLIARLEELLGPTAPPGPAPMPTPEPPPAVPRRRRSYGGPRLVVLLVGLAAASLVVNRFVDDATSPETTHAASSVRGRDAEVEMGRSLWYAGFKITLQRAVLHTVGDVRRLDVAASLENQGDQDVVLERTIFVESHSRSHELAYSSDLPTVPGRSTGKGTLSFEVGNDFSLGDAVVTFGASDRNQAVVPLGSAGTVASLEPVPVVFAATRLSAGRLTLDVRRAEARADDPLAGGYRQAPRGHRFLVVDFASIATTVPYGQNVFNGTIVVTLPDGTTVAADSLNELPYPDKPAVDFRASYLVDDPPQGAYKLVLRDDATASVDFTVG